jgi:hypothetical protein
MCETVCTRDRTSNCTMPLVYVHAFEIGQAFPRAVVCGYLLTLVTLMMTNSEDWVANGLCFSRSRQKKLDYNKVRVMF